MPPTAPHQSDHQRKWATTKWATTLRQEMLTMIGHLLRAQHELPQELSPEMTALLMRMDEQHGLKP
jgi:hypothetical protein